MTAPTIASRVTNLEQDRATVLEILKDHSEALQRLDSKADKIADDVATVKDDVAWIRKKLS